MEKVVLTKYQAEAIKWLRDRPISKERLIEFHVDVLRLDDNWVQHNEALREVNIDTLIRALYHPEGYEVDKTEQEKIQEIWEGKSGMTMGELYKDRLIISKVLLATGREDLIPKEG